ncbi:MAG: ABC transporter ATP-binding protein [Eubacteriales bacterium]|nr:ABC transporter ATP-binding protein [Eubacteriales bacterium]
MVSVSNLTKQYGDYRLNISMEIPNGRIVGLVGKNGAGKSTTIKAILGLIKADSGSVTVFGKDVASLTGDDKRRIGVALSDSGFSSYLSAGDVAKILAKMYPGVNEKDFLNKCHRYGLTDPNKQIKNYSTGMKAKLRVLIALSHNADLLIMDEPTAGLDIEARNEILDILRGYLSENENRSILITSHIATDLEGLCDEIYLIHNGEVLLHEETDVILSDYAVIKVDEEGYEALDKRYILKSHRESYGYRCLTNERGFYRENYPGLTMEKGGIDDLILLMTGEK